MKTNKQTVTPNDHERSEWRRMANNASTRGFMDVSAYLNNAARLTELPLAEFDAIQSKYREWLINGRLV